MHFVVLSSSRGSTLQAVLDALGSGALQARCLGLVSDRPDRGCVEKAKAAGLPVRIEERGEGESAEAYDQRLHASLLALGLHPPSPGGQAEGKERGLWGEAIACIGWMFILTPWFIGQWRGRIINVHPALLPKYGGRGMYGMRVHEAVLRAGERESGITIHRMDEGVDTGEILLQKTCPVLPDDTPERLKERVQGLEKEWYPKVLQQIHEGGLVMD
jgi:phosphoribosylglycinamide formyltransferase 1